MFFSTLLAQVINFRGFKFQHRRARSLRKYQTALSFKATVITIVESQYNRPIWSGRWISITEAIHSCTFMRITMMETSCGIIKLSMPIMLLRAHRFAVFSSLKAKWRFCTPAWSLQCRKLRNLSSTIGTEACKPRHVCGEFSPVYSRD